MYRLKKTLQEMKITGIATIMFVVLFFSSENAFDGEAQHSTAIAAFPCKCGCRILVSLESR